MPGIAWLRTAADMRRVFGTVRARTTLGAVIVVGAALLGGAFGFMTLLRGSLRENVEDVAEARATEVAAMAGAGTLPEVLTVGAVDEAVAQVIDEQGRVIAASAALAGAPRIAFIAPAGNQRETATVRITAVDNDPFRVVAMAASSPAGPVTVYAAGSLDGVEESVAVVARILAVGVPLLLILVGGTAWTITGRALRPVDAMRAQVGELSASSLDRHLPEPAGDDEIARLARTMNAMLDRVRTATERQRRFVADASHELLSPLASCRVELEIALAASERADWRATATGVLDEHDRMERLVRDLLVLARLDEGDERDTAETIDLDDLVLAEAARLRRRGHVHVDNRAVTGAEVRGHRDDLRRVIRNLADNAERHARHTVIFSLQPDVGMARIVVADDGPGIPPADRARVFERFSRLDTARSRGAGGAGLGLAIVREVVRAHGGTVSIEDAHPGARVVLQLPLAG